jgi:hypothetical protein
VKKFRQQQKIRPSSPLPLRRRQVQPAHSTLGRVQIVARRPARLRISRGFPPSSGHMVEQYLKCDASLEHRPAHPLSLVPLVASLSLWRHMHGQYHIITRRLPSKFFPIHQSSYYSTTTHPKLGQDLLGAVAQLRKVTITFVMSVHLFACISAPHTGRFSIKLYLGLL